MTEKDTVSHIYPRYGSYSQTVSERLLQDINYRERHLHETIVFAASLLFELIGNCVKPDSQVRIVLEGFEDDIVRVTNAWKLPSTERKIATVSDIYSRISSVEASNYIGYVLTDACEILEYEKDDNANDDLGLLHVAGRHTAIFTGKDTLIQKGYADDLVMAGLDNLATSKVDRLYLPELDV